MSAPKTESKTGETRAASKKSAGGDRISITLHKSGICTPKDQKATLQGLGFRRLGQTVVREDSPAVRGMVRKVRHLVAVTKG